MYVNSVSLVTTTANGWFVLSESANRRRVCFQDDILNELLSEMKALRAVVLAQSQRIELLERQLARIEDGDVWTSAFRSPVDEQPLGLFNQVVERCWTVIKSKNLNFTM